MSNSIWALLFVILGLIGIVLANNFTSITTINEQNYHLVEEVTEAAMYDSIDLAYYRYYQTDEDKANYHDNVDNVRIIEEKFVENFIRRYAESANFNKTYKIEIYDIQEYPPKVSLLVGSNSELVFSDDGFDIENNIDAILEVGIEKK